MNKKGIGFVDWIISMSLFLVVVLMIFAFLRPGVVPDVESEDLLTIVELNMLEEVTWSVMRIPVSIGLINSDVPTIKIQHELASEWGFVDIEVPVGVNMANVVVNMNPNGKVIQIKCASGVTCSTTTSLVDDPATGIYILSMPKAQGAPIDMSLIKSSCVGPPDDCIFSLGAKEVVTGLHMVTLQSLINDPDPGALYEAKKTAWDFPSSRSFSVWLDPLDGSAQFPLLQPKEPVPAQASVFVKEIAVSLLRMDGTRVPGIMNIRVW